MKSLLFSLLLVSPLLAAANLKGVSVQAPPAWVKEVGLKNVKSPDGSGGTHLLLDDTQVNFQTNETYKHLAFRLLTSEGVQQFSDFTVGFDPGYQKLYLHEVRIIRDGQFIQKLDINRLKVLDNETQMDRYIYNGAVSVVLNLTDIRKGDILEYSYTLSGKNEAYPEHDFFFRYFQHTTPIACLSFRLLEHPARPLKIFRRNNAPAPEKQVVNGQVEWYWYQEDIPAKITEDNTPSWYDPYSMVEVSNYQSWEQVVKTCLPHYPLDGNYQPLLKQIPGIDTAKNASQKLRLITDFVQNDIRYLGFEDGRNGYIPTAPEEVMNQRFGDCKGKSYLLCALFSAVGYDAYPVLVNTSLTKSVDEYTISPFQFNHCVVALQDQRELVYIDPTINAAGGPLNKRNFPAYEKGLIIRKGEKRIAALNTENSRGSVKVYQDISVPEDSTDESLFKIRTEYKGVQADYIRSYFQSSTLESIGQDYLEYYSSIYPNMELKEDLRYEDKPSENTFVTWESYRLPRIWFYDPAQEIYQLETYALSLENYAYVEKTPARSAPYALSSPVEIDVHINLMPLDWSGGEEEDQIDRDAYVYSFKSNYDEKYRKLSLHHHYHLKQSYLEAGEYDTFIKDHEKMQAAIGFNVIYDFGPGSDSSDAWVGGLIVFLMVGGVIVLSLHFFRKVWKNANPEPEKWVKQHRQVGGWLLLIALHLIVSPLRNIYELISGGYLKGSNMYYYLFSDLMSNRDSAIIFFTALILLCSISAQVFLNLAFFKRRSFFPKAFTIYYIFFAVFLLADGTIGNIIEGQAFHEGMLPSILGVVIYSVVLIPALWNSERANETFVTTYRLREEAENWSAENSQPLV